MSKFTYKRNRDMRILFLAFIAMILSPMIAYSSAPDMSVSPASQSAGSGSPVTVNLIADLAQNEDGVNLTLTYDPNLLTSPSCSMAGAADSSWSGNMICNTSTPGQIIFQAYTTNSAQDINGSSKQIVTISFTSQTSSDTCTMTSGVCSNLSLSAVSFADDDVGNTTTTVTSLTNGFFSLASAVNGACGSADKTYAYGSSSYGTDTFCSTGTASPSSPSFPTAGNTVDWTCDGSGGGTNASCSASQPPSAAPVITGEPGNQTANAGGSATFSVTATGVPTPNSYQWKLSTDGGSTFNDIGGATSSSYTVNSVSSSDNGNEYECVVSNGISPDATSSAAILTVDYAPTISTDPVSQTADAGTPVTFTAAATGNPTPNYQWQVSTNGGSSFSNVGGATSASYTINTVSSSQNGYEYQCVASNGVSPNATTTAATLTVDYAPVITTNPINQTRIVGMSATFSVVANANPAPGYQWEVSTDGGSTFSDIGGANSSSYTLSSLTLAESGYEYKCVVSNTLSSTTSTAATLTVTLAPVNGQCGTAAQLYSYGATSFGSNALCAEGNPFPSSVAFPHAGQTVGWICQGLNNGLNARCFATQRPKIVFRFW